MISEPWVCCPVQAARWVRANRSAKLVLHGCDTVWHHGALTKQLARRVLLWYILPAVDAWLLFPCTIHIVGYVRLRRRPAYILDVQAIRDKDLPNGIKNKARTGLLGKLQAKRCPT